MAKADVLIVEAPYYTKINAELVKGATQTLAAAGKSFEMLSVPGAFEIPAAIALAADHFKGFVALGCVIRGETSHYDYVCGESARKLQDLATDRGLAIGYGIITVENEAQAWARAKVDEKNKGRDAALACVAMMALKDRFSK